MHSATLLVSSLALLVLFVSYISTDESLPFEQDFPELSTDDDYPKVRAIRAHRRGGGGGGRRPQSPPNRPTLRLGPRDTRSANRQQAWFTALDANKISRNAQPVSRTKVDEMGYGKRTGKKLDQWEFVNKDNQKITIREDKATVYPDGGSQPPHFNGGPSWQKLSQHHYYEKKN